MANSGYEPAEYFQSSRWLSYSVNKSLTSLHHVYRLCFCTSCETTNPDEDFPGQTDFCFFFFMVILVALNQKKSSVINLSIHSSAQYDLNFNYLFNCLVYHEAHLPNNRTWRESWAFASSQFGGYSLLNRLLQSGGAVPIWFEVQSPVLSMG